MTRMSISKPEERNLKSDYYGWQLWLTVIDDNFFKNLLLYIIIIIIIIIYFF